MASGSIRSLGNCSTHDSLVKIRGLWRVARWAGEKEVGRRWAEVGRMCAEGVKEEGRR